MYNQAGDRVDGDNMIIIVTDGIPTRNEENTQEEARRTHDAGIKVYAIGITQFIDEATLKFLSSSPQEKDTNYFTAPDFGSLQNILDSVLQSTCGATPTPTPRRKLWSVLEHFLCWMWAWPWDFGYHFSFHHIFTCHPFVACHILPFYLLIHV